MNHPLGKTNENVNYPTQANSSAASWISSTSDQGSFAALIKNKALILPQDAQILAEASIQPTREWHPASV